MKEQNFLVEYELAIKLKDKGFNDDVFGLFYSVQKTPFHSIGDIVKVRAQNINYIIAPTHQQAIDWFNEKHRIRIFTKPTVGGNFTFGIYTWLGGSNGWEKHTGIVEKSFNTNTEALNFAIEESLKLIPDK